MGKQPGFFFYTGDWLKDTRCLSLEARGAWIDLLCALWESPTRGEITWPLQALDQYLGTIERDGLIYSAMEILEELAALQICYIVTHDNKKVTIGNRRMAREENERKSTASRVKRWRDRKSNVKVTSPLPSSSSSSSSDSIKDTISVSDFAESWNEQFKDQLPCVALPMNGSRNRKVSARLKEHQSLEFWQQVFTNIKSSKFLLGLSNGSWRATLDWIVANDTNCVKVYEGTYADKRG